MVASDAGVDDGGAGRPADFVQSFERGLAVIRAFGPDDPELTLSDVARATGLTRAAARRFLLTLVELGYVRTDGRLFALRPRVLELGYAYLSSLTLPEVARPHMEELVAQLHETSNLSVLDGDDIVYVARVATRKIMSVRIDVGTRLPAHATSMGRVLLAARGPHEVEDYLRRARIERYTAATTTDPARLLDLVASAAADGYALVDQELEDGLRSVAVPVRDGTGAVAAALNVATPSSRYPVDRVLAEMLPAVRAAAQAVEADLALAPAPAGAGALRRPPQPARAAAGWPPPPRR